MIKELSTHAAAASAIRKELKKLKVKAKVNSERFSMGNAVSVYLEDISPAMMEVIYKITSKYQYGAFNSMEDYYDMNNVIQGIAQVKYVHVNNRPSDVLKEKITEALTATKYPGFIADSGFEAREIIRKVFINKEFWDAHLTD